MAFECTMKRTKMSSPPTLRKYFPLFLKVLSTKIFILWRLCGNFYILTLFSLQNPEMWILKNPFWLTSSQNVHSPRSRISSFFLTQFLNSSKTNIFISWRLSGQFYTLTLFTHKNSKIWILRNPLWLFSSHYVYTPVSKIISFFRTWVLNALQV